jgi:hypothetical protein
LDPYTRSLYRTNDKNKLFLNDWNMQTLKFSFSIPATEKTTGTHIIPTVLASLMFLIPGIDIDKDVEYDIMQAHKFAYHFRFRNLAGWRIIGAVNTVVVDFKALYHLFDSQLGSQYRDPTYSPHILSVYPLNPMASFQSTILRVKEKCFANLLAVMPAGTPAHTAFQNGTFNSKEEAALPNDGWQHFISCIGLGMVDKYLSIQIDSTSYKQLNLVTSNIFADRMLKAPLSTYVFTPAELLEALSFFFRFCDGLAYDVIDAVDASISVATLKGQLNMPDIGEITLTPDSVATFWTSCTGVSPGDWPSKLYTGPLTVAPFPDAQHLAGFMLTRGGTFHSAFSLLYPAKLLGTGAAIGALIKSAHSYNPSIMKARIAHARPAAAATGNALRPILAYALFTGSMAVFP